MLSISGRSNAKQIKASNAKQSKAKQNKAKQNKANQSKAVQADNIEDNYVIGPTLGVGEAGSGQKITLGSAAPDPQSFSPRFRVY